MQTSRIDTIKNTVIAVSFITPTINYSTWICTSKSVYHSDILSTVTTKCNEFRPYSSDELNIACTSGRFNRFIISGDLSHLYASFVDLPPSVQIQAQTIRIGSSILRIQIVRELQTVPLIDDVVVHGATLSSLLSDSQTCTDRVLPYAKHIRRVRIQGW
jgi:hypothetical protein